MSTGSGGLNGTRGRYIRSRVPEVPLVAVGG